MPRSQPVTEQRPTSSNLRVLTQLLVFVRPYRGALFCAVIALLIAAGAVLGFGVVLRHMVDYGLSNGSVMALNQALLLFLLVVIIMAVSVAARLYLVTWLGERVVADIRRAVFAQVLKLEPAFFEVTRTGEVISRLTTDTSLLQVVVGSTLAIAVRNVLLIAGGLVMLAITSAKLALLVLLGVPLVIVPLWLLGHRVRGLSRQSQDRIADVGAYVGEVLYGIRTVQAFCHERIDEARYGNQVEAAFHTAIQRTRVSALLTGLVMLLTFTAISLVLWVGGHDVLVGRITGGQLSAFVFYAVLVAGSIGALSEVAGNLLRAAGATERLLELLDTKPKIALPVHPVALPEPARGEVELRNVTFHYPSRPETAALRKLSLNLRPGRKVALVGPSGAGKSTVLQLLLRFYDPDEGVIRFDGVDLRAADPQQLRKRVALVPQDPVIFGADAWENIRYGHANVSAAQIRRAAEAAHAAEFLDQLPQGFDTFLGERGIRLSGGQRQRIAIARAILRDPALLLLDEATSSLDAESERFVQDGLEQLMRGRSTLIIAHRLATVRKVDEILVMDRGYIVARGRHDKLINEHGLYARLAALQFRDAPETRIQAANE
ncbi:ABC transporter transmembrane domain-containing protein [Nitrococcus mobilis]|uniref:ABC transporter, ATP-binding/permease protein n=1 Tax=Nitrococcus mobilis Nb-231 TaxID=314278 RepID=A4BT91_9GAMM|nr:ABC transporter transmembrane domain-containing protein [Nitrococcus mobilis]EAR20993.1 ABC transporter, ATP-binding/permease protein [Nitrococcus mobilis Nb-231]